MNQTTTQKIADAASAKLGTSCKIVRWIKKNTGDVPVFAVPLEVRDRAIALGLTVCAIEKVIE